MTAPLPDILSPEFAANPYSIYRELRNNHPLLFHSPTKSYLISRYIDVERAFKDSAFSTRCYEWQHEPVFGRTIVQMDGRAHVARRNLIGLAMRGRALHEKCAPIITRIADELIDSFRRNGAVEFVDAFAARLPVYVILELLGLPRAEQELLYDWCNAIAAFFANITQDPLVEAAGLRAGREIREYVQTVIEQRRRQPADDLISALCHAQIDGARLSDEEIQSICSLLVVGGGETTDKALRNLFVNLVAHPKQLAAVRADRTLVERAVAETLRYSPPVQMLARMTTEAVTLSGGTIPAGATVLCLIGAANRDDRMYRDPDRFDIFRADLDMQRAFSAGANHLAFALGRHYCLGAMLARVQCAIATNLLLDRMHDLAFAEPPRAEGLFIRAPVRLALTFTPA